MAGRVPTKDKIARSFELEALTDMLLTASGNDKKILLEKIDYLKERWGLSSSTVEGKG